MEIKKIIVDLDTLPIEKIIGFIEENNKVEIIVLTQYNPDLLKKIKKDISVSYYPSPCTSKKNEQFKVSPDKVWKHLIDDHQTFMLYDRELFFPKRTNFLTYEIIKLGIACQQYLEEEKPDAIFFIATPHHFHTWIFAKVAQAIGIPIYYMQSTIFPWRYYLCKGLSSTPEIIAYQAPEICENEEKLINNYINSKKKNNRFTMPFYERERLKENKEKYFCWKTELKKWYKRPDLIINKIFCYRKYIALSKNFTIPSKYIVFFLHYQPERTTLPEGYGFAQQLLAIEILRMAIPQNITLIIKEHPSTYTGICSWKERTPSYYQQITNIPNVQLVPLEQDAYTLIDNSIASATITGTIAGESVIRGTPTIVFGNSPIKLLSNNMVHQYNDIYSLQDFVKKLSGEHQKEKINFDFLLKDILGSFSGINYNSCKHLNINKIYNKQYTLFRHTAILKALNFLLKK